MRETEPVATPAELAEHLRVSEPTIKGWRYKGEGPPFIRVARNQVRYRWRDVEAWLDANRVAGGPDAAA